MHAFVVGGVNGGETTNPRKLIVSTSEIIQIPEAKTHQQNHGPIKDLNYHMALPTKTLLTASTERSIPSHRWRLALVVWLNESALH